MSAEEVRELFREVRDLRSRLDRVQFLVWLAIAAAISPEVADVIRACLG